MKRARLVAALFLLLSIVNCALQYADLFAFLLYSAVMWFLRLITSIYCDMRIFLALRNLMQVHVSPQEQQNGISPFNVTKYKRTVSTALWIFAALIICYAPFGLLLIINPILPELSGSLADLYFFFRGNVGLFKFIAERNAVFLEDQRGKTCGEGNTQEFWLL